MELCGYKQTKRLGKGTYGQVYLVEDQNSNQYAIKCISKSAFEKEPYLEEYLEDEIQLMTKLKHKHILNLYDVKEDESMKYLICEYCDGGDLLNVQTKLPDKIFKLDAATEVLAQVIRGLEYLHQNGYLHRDIKSENIICKVEQGTPVYKLADFGFAKKDLCGAMTVLGTQPYMSPEIFKDDIYSFEVDMWAFGVVFYFMLNFEFPFKFSNPHAEPSKKRKQLIKQAEKFSYRGSVQKSKKKVMDNCTPEMEDLFSQIFNIDGEQRISFISIREHPIFRRHFPEISSMSRIIYKSKVTSGFQQKVRNGLKSVRYSATQKKNFDQESAYIKQLCSRFELLSELEEEVVNQSRFFDFPLFISYRYLVNQLNVIMLAELLDKELKLEKLLKDRPDLSWKQFYTNKEFTTFLKHYNRSFSEAEKKVIFLEEECYQVKSDIANINPHFMKCFKKKSTTYDTSFEAAYETSNIKMYEAIRAKYSAEKKSKFLKLLAIITVSHVIWKLVHDSDENLLRALPTYFQGQKSTSSLGQFRIWTNICSGQDLKNTIKEIIQQYFQK